MPPRRMVQGKKSRIADGDRSKETTGDEHDLELQYSGISTVLRRQWSLRFVSIMVRLYLFQLGYQADVLY